MSKRVDVEKLRQLAAKAEGEEWFVQHAATTDGLSRIDDGCQHGMFPIYGEAHEIAFAAACVNFVRNYVVPLTPAEMDEKAWRDSGERERVKTSPLPSPSSDGGL